VPGAAALYAAHPDVFLVTACLKYKPIRDMFEAAVLGTLGGCAKRGQVACKRPASATSPKAAHEASSASPRAGHESPAPLPPHVWRKVWAAFLGRLRTDARVGVLDEWAVNYGRGRGQPPWQWLVRWGVLRVTTHDDPGAVVLGRTAYSEGLPTTVAGADFMASVTSMVGAVWLCQSRPPGTQCLV
jgi:hypothetical protein